MIRSSIDDIWGQLLRCLNGYKLKILTFPSWDPDNKRSFIWTIFVTALVWDKLHA